MIVECVIREEVKKKNMIFSQNLCLGSYLFLYPFQFTSSIMISFKTVLITMVTNVFRSYFKLT